MNGYRLYVRGRRKTNLFGSLPAFVVVIVLLLMNPTDQAFAREAGTWEDVVFGAMLGAYRHGTYPSWGNRTHVGIDLLAECGTPILAYQEGTVRDVIMAGSDKDFRSLGYMVIIEHPEHLMGRKFYTLYLHMAAPPSVRKGQPVAKGAKVGLIGTTGAANDTCHTHFETRYFPDRFSAWGNIYGMGDKRNDAYFKQQWADPFTFLSTAFKADSTSPSIGHITNVNAISSLSGCGCNFRLNKESQPIFRSVLDGRDEVSFITYAVMKIDGREVLLKAKPYVIEGDLGKNENADAYRGDNIVVHVDKVSSSPCKGSECELMEMEVMMTVTTGAGEKTFRAIGDCGC